MIEVRNITSCDYSIRRCEVNELCKYIYIKLRNVSIITLNNDKYGLYFGTPETCRYLNIEVEWLPPDKKFFLI